MASSHRPSDLTCFIFLQDKERGGLARNYDASHSGGLNSGRDGHRQR